MNLMHDQFNNEMPWLINNKVEKNSGAHGYISTYDQRGEGGNKQ